MWSVIYNQRNHKSTTHHTLKIPITRLLCECELYAPVNYDNDPEMKEVMQDFDRQTSQRFEEYNERMMKNKQKCREQCEKDIQKIILKDKIDKELTEKFATLQTDIQSDSIPTCICEKSLADKVEKNCLRCGYGLGTVAPTVGLIGSVAVHVWKPKALEAAIAAALKAGATEISTAGIEAGEAAGMEFVIKALKHFGVENFFPGICDTISSTGHYANITNFVDLIYSQYGKTCIWKTSAINPTACYTIETKLSIRTGGSAIQGPPPQHAIRELLNGLAEEATEAAKAAEAAKNA
ncbi:hypothetical protein PFUGPA_06040, partial [Plasmodium falciparum Palo Alto/Uganda]